MQCSPSEKIKFLHAASKVFKVVSDYSFFLSVSNSRFRRCSADMSTSKFIKHEDMF